MKEIEQINKLKKQLTEQKEIYESLLYRIKKLLEKFSGIKK